MKETTQDFILALVKVAVRNSPFVVSVLALGLAAFALYVVLVLTEKLL